MVPPTTPPPRDAFWDLYLDPEMLPPTHPRGPRRPFPIKLGPDALQGPMYQPRPPSERGWTQDRVGDPHGVYFMVPDGCSVDRTFENETRPHR